MNSSPSVMIAKHFLSIFVIILLTRMERIGYHCLIYSIIIIVIVVVIILIIKTNNAGSKLGFLVQVEWESLEIGIILSILCLVKKSRSFR
jgi:hypothetical protein